eukprot:superscaffoldBa00000091_g1344
MLWTDVSYHDMEKIDKMQSIPDLESALCGVFGVDLPEPRRAVQLELYVQTVLFCKECSFKKEQTSALLSIIKSIHEANIGKLSLCYHCSGAETPLNNIEQCFEYCKELLLCHSVRRPPFSINLFSSEEVNCIFKYIQNSYMRHYKLYKYIFTPQVKLDLSLTYSGIPDQDDQTMKSDPGSKSELKALIEQEVREQMTLVSGQLDQRVKEIADQHNCVLDSLQPNHKAKK